MSEKSYVTPEAQGLVITKKGSFDVNALYKNISIWYFKKNYDFTEKENTNKISGSGSEIKLILNGERKVDAYVKFHIDILIEVLDYKERKGNLRIRVDSYVELDYDGKWENTRMNKFLRYVYHNLIIKSRITNYYEAKLYEELVEFNKVAKKALGLLS